MNLNSDDFYKTLKERLEQLPEQEPTEADWESFAAINLQGEKNKKSILWYIIPVSLLFSVTLLGYFFLVQTNIKTNKIAETSIVARKGSIARTFSNATKTNSSQTVATKKNNDPVKSEKTKSKKNISIKNITEPNESSLNTNSSLVNTSSTSISSPNLVLSEPNSNAITNPEIVNIWLASKGVKALPSIPFYAVPKPLTFGSNRKIKRPLKADRVSVWAIPVVTNSQNNSINYGAGFQLGKDFGKGWFISAGLEYAQKNSQQSQNWKHSFESHDLIRIDTNLRIDASLNRIVMVMDSVYDYRKHEETVSRKTYNNTRNIDIPIELGYGIGVGKMMITSSIGIYNRIKYTQTNQLEAYPLSKNENSAYSEKYSYQLLSSLGLSAAYPINKRLWVQAAPNLLFNPFERKITHNETRFRFGIKYYLN